MAEFKILISGLYKEHDVQVSRTDEIIKDSRWVSDICDEEWEKLKEMKRKSGEKEPFDGLISRYVNHEVENAKVSFNLGRMNYKQYIGYRTIAPAFIEFFGSNALPRRLGNTSVVILNDDDQEKFLLVRRTRDVADYPYWIGAGGAGAVPIDADNVYDGMRHELKKEWGIEAKDIDSMIMTGLIADGLARDNTEVSFATKIKLSPEALEAIPFTEERWEHEKQAREKGKKQYGIYLPHDPVSISNFITNYDDMIMPTSQGTIVLYGKTNPFNVSGFGESWYNSVMEILCRKWVENAYELSTIERTHSELIKRKYGLR
jgi:hypothetical protein